MKLTFIYDGTLFYDDNGDFYGRAYAALPEKYRSLADDVTFVMRTEPIHDTSGHMKMPDGIHVASIPDISNPIIYLTKKRDVVRIVSKQISESDIVILREPCFFSKIVNRALKKYGKPYMVEVVGCPWDSYRNHSLVGKLLAPVECLNTKKSVLDAPFVCYVTTEFLQKRYPTRGVACGISDVELMPADDAVLAAKFEKISSHSGVWKIGTAGAVNVPYKGQQYVIEALAKLRSQGRTDFEYHMAGGGDQTRLRTLADKLGVGDQVVFEGNIPHDKMFDWLDGLDIYVQPSLQEGLPRAVVEAMSRALPVLGAKTGGIPELVGQSCIFPQKDSGRLAEMLTMLSCETMKKCAQDNFSTASGFEYDTLEKRRNAFYLKFKETFCEAGNE